MGSGDEWLERHAARLQGLKDLRQEALAANLVGARDEDARLKRDAGQEARLERRRQKALRSLARSAALRAGGAEAAQEIVRSDTATYTIEETARWRDHLAAKEAARDPGFTDYNQLTRRKYEKLSGAIDAAAVAARSPREGAEALAQALAAEAREREAGRARRRGTRYDPTADVTFINERNYRFNQKAARAYDEYTADIKDALERGTAL